MRALKPQFLGMYTITGGNVEIDPAHKLIANEITITRWIRKFFFRGPIRYVTGASYHDPHRAEALMGELLTFIGPLF